MSVHWLRTIDISDSGDLAAILKALPGASEAQRKAAARILTGAILPDFVNNYFEHGSGSWTERDKGRQ